MPRSTILFKRFHPDPLFILRIWIGITFIFHGWPGIFSAEYMAAFAGYLESIEVPFPTLSAYLSAGSEFFCGVLLLIGLFTRPAALLVAINMAVATFLAHDGDIFADGEQAAQGEQTLTYFVIAVVLFLWGATRYSLDYLLWKKKE